MSQLFNRPLGASHDLPASSRPSTAPRVEIAPRPIPPTMLPEANMSAAVQHVMRLTSYRDPKGAVAAVKAAYVLLGLPGHPVPTIEQLVNKAMLRWA